MKESNDLLQVAATVGFLLRHAPSLARRLDCSCTNANAPVYGYRCLAVSLNGEIPSAQNKRAFIDYTYVQANYFQTLGIPLLFGRNFQPEAGQSEASVILSESAAKWLWPGENPIGRSLRLGADGQFHRKSEPPSRRIPLPGDRRRR